MIPEVKICGIAGIALYGTLFDLGIGVPVNLPLAETHCDASSIRMAKLLK